MLEAEDVHHVLLLFMRASSSSLGGGCLNRKQMREISYMRELDYVSAALNAMVQQKRRGLGVREWLQVWETSPPNMSNKALKQVIRSASGMIDTFAPLRMPAHLAQADSEKLLAEPGEKLLHTLSVAAALGLTEMARFILQTFHPDISAPVAGFCNVLEFLSECDVGWLASDECKRLSMGGNKRKWVEAFAGNASDESGDEGEENDGIEEDEAKQQESKHRLSWAYAQLSELLSSSPSPVEPSKDSTLSPLEAVKLCG